MGIEIQNKIHNENQSFGIIHNCFKKNLCMVLCVDLLILTALGTNLVTHNNNNNPCYIHVTM